MSSGFWGEESLFVNLKSLTGFQNIIFNAILLKHSTDFPDDMRGDDKDTLEISHRLLSDHMTL